MAVVCEERIDLIRCNYLLDNYDFNDFYTEYNGNEKDARKDFKKLQDYLLCKINRNIYTKYNYVKGRTNGRLYGDKTSIQNIPKFIRSFLCEKKTTDVDLQNAHPQLLYQLCKKYEYECVYLEKYVKNRDEILSRIMDATQKTREEAKKIILTATNTNKNINIRNYNFVQNYSKEMKKIQNQFIENNDFNYVKGYAKNDGNFEGSFINHILCIHEEQCLKIMRDYCNDNKLSIHSLAFDGLMLNGDFHNDFNLLKELENQISEKSIFEMKLVYKEQETNIEIPNDYKPIIKLDYNGIKEKFEKNNCKVGVEFINENETGYDIYKVGEFKTLHQELKFYNEKIRKNCSFIDVWLEDEDKRRYDRFECFPVDCPENVYNTWLKFNGEILSEVGVCEEEYCKDALAYFLNLIKILCNNEDKVYEFVLLWLAQLIQYPTTKSIQLNFISQEGCGKGTFLRFLRKMLGDKKVFEPEKPQDEVFGTYNPSMESAYLVVFNEANKSKFYNSNDMVKQLITDPKITIKEKYVKNKIINSYHRFMIFSNHAEPSTKNKRRDLFIRCSDELIGNIPYFIQATEYIENESAIKYIYDYFKVYPTQKLISVVDIPEVEYDKEIAETQEVPLLRWLKGYIYGVKDDKEIKISSSAFFMLYNDWYKSTFNTSNELKLQSFGMKISFYKFKSITKKVMRMNEDGINHATNVYTLDIQCLIKELKIDINYFDSLEEFVL
tara:strand:+ start:477 stop:2645 length:2169 start_codon:yes stop_codon:yes gene_type:complete